MKISPLSETTENMTILKRGIVFHRYLCMQCHIEEKQVYDMRHSHSFNSLVILKSIFRSGFLTLHGHTGLPSRMELHQNFMNNIHQL